MKLHPFWNSFPEMETRLQKTAESIEHVLEDSPRLIKNELETFLLKPGKMLRPAFVLMASTVSEQPPESVYPVAAAIELLHIATLVHDDVLDNSGERRGIPTLHTKIGIKKAVLAGDYLLARALQMASIAHSDLTVDSMNQSIINICINEIDQDDDLGNYFISRETYFNRIRGKTAEMFALSARAGAILGGGDDAARDSFYNAGINFGMAFQIDDDVMDYRGTSKAMGKPGGNDLRDGVPTLPLILALEGGDRELTRLCSSRFKYRFRKRIRGRVLAGNYDKKAEEIGEEYRKKCLDQLVLLEFGDRELFSQIINKLVLRNY